MCPEAIDDGCWTDTLPFARAPFRRIFPAAVLVLAAQFSGQALASDYAPTSYVPAVQFGYGNDDKHHIDKYEVVFRWDSGHAWGNPEGWLLGLGYEMNVAYWHSTASDHPQSPWEIGAAPVLTLGWHRYDWIPFVEASIGVRLLTATRTSESHEFSTAFQFGEYLGAGVAFGKDMRFAVGYRFQHISNGGIKQPNPGTTFNTVYVRYRF